MELGADGVLLNTGIAHAKDPVKMGARHAARGSNPENYLTKPAGFRVSVMRLRAVHLPA